MPVNTTDDADDIAPPNTNTDNGEADTPAGLPTRTEDGEAAAGGGVSTPNKDGEEAAAAAATVSTTTTDDNQAVGEEVEGSAVLPGSNPDIAAMPPPVSNGCSATESEEY